MLARATLNGLAGRVVARGPPVAYPCNTTKMTNLRIIQEFSRTPANIQGQQDVFQESRTKQVLIANSKTILGAQGRLATLA